jgi:copper(I)-binding protein
MPGAPAAGYFTLANGGAASAVLTRASSPACGSLMFHRSDSRNGTNRMEMVEAVTVPAGGEIRFAPGDYHLMCSAPRPDLVVGAKVPVTLSFADGRELTSGFDVRGLGEP